LRRSLADFGRIYLNGDVEVDAMQVTKLGEGLAVVLPDSIVESHDLKEGDEVDIEIRRASGVASSEADARTREEAVERLREVKRSLAAESDSERQQRREAALKVFDELSRPLPEDFKFDREEANAR
jgi:antitoxin MazE